MKKKLIILYLSIYFLFLSVIILLFHQLNKREEINRLALIDTDIESFLDIIDADLIKRIESLERLANRWVIRGGTPRREFESDVLTYIRDDEGYQAIEWVDSSLHVKWVVPLIGNEQAEGLDLGFEESRRTFLMISKSEKKSVMSAPIDLVQGGKGFLIYVPIYIDEEFDGFILAVFKSEEWLDALINSSNFKDIISSFHVKVYIDDILAYISNDYSELNNSEWVRSNNHIFMGHKISVEFIPKKRFLVETNTFLAEFFLGFGIVVITLITIVLILLQKTAKSRDRILEIKEDLAKERLRLSYILEGTNVGTWEWNVQTGETVFNEHWANILGYTLDEISPVSIDTWIKFAHPDDLEISGELLQKNFSKELDFYECEARMKHKNGDWVWVLDRGKVATWTEDGKPLLMCGTHKDITEKKDAESEIEYLATHDSLTSLPNLRIAQDRIETAVKVSKRKGNKLAILFVDLDGFKNVNDTYGHDAGDFVLKTIANILETSVREVDTVARIGGDEFLIVLTEISDREIARTIAGKIIDKIRIPIIYKNSNLNIGSSIGIALYPENGEDIETLIKEADNAMYDVKKNGKNNYTFAKNSDK